MKIKLNPMEQLVKRAERRINFHKAVSAQDLAHDRKRQLAKAVMAGSSPTLEFEQAARIEGKTPQELAALIMSKPDVMMQRENSRRELVMKVRAAKTPEELQNILDTHAVNWHPEDKVPGMVK